MKHAVGQYPLATFQCSPPSLEQTEDNSCDWLETRGAAAFMK